MKEFENHTPLGDLGIGLHIIASRPAMGKTTLMIQSARLSDKNCLIYSLDTPFEGIVERIKVIKSSIKYGSSKTIYIRDDLVNIEDVCRDAKGQDGTIYIDYLQLLKSNQKFNSSQKEREYITQQLYELSRDRCVIVFSQVNSKAEKRQGHIPLPEDIRFYEKIGETADTVITFLCDNYYSNAPVDYDDAKFYFYRNGNSDKILNLKRRNDTGTFGIIK